MQGKFQAAGIFVSLAMALVGGLFVGEWEWPGHRWGHCGALRVEGRVYQRPTRSSQEPFVSALVSMGLGDFAS